MLQIRADLVEEIMAHARAEHPHEACGMIAGAEGTERPERFFRMTNAAKPTGDAEAQEREQAHRALVLGEAHAEYAGEPRSSLTYYTWDVKERLRAQREMDERDEWPTVIYHSHTRSEAYPSQVDIDVASGPANDPRIHYVIVSTRPDAEARVRGHDLRSFRIVDGVVTEEEVDVVETYMFAHTGADDVPDLG
ncbi:Mov34/MPN/PAD-1 family protein [Pseudonocardia broussonetiae]|uniref:M67 family metallopeptidase n=1 Tax=Pseudonocardia broussonetiae TaxID=2736640 RepID=A0A6M6JA34_9PSEU|nr:M67 family metallopeptidase [Pseudonocardia broussonetiae]QJY44724.1 M67 family metallopeptidase [Pseudonocardia broussonetiae]